MPLPDLEQSPRRAIGNPGTLLPAADGTNTDIERLGEERLGSAETLTEAAHPCRSVAGRRRDRRLPEGSPMATGGPERATLDGHGLCHAVDQQLSQVAAPLHDHPMVSESGVWMNQLLAPFTPRHDIDNRRPWLAQSRR